MWRLRARLRLHAAAQLVAIIQGNEPLTCLPFVQHQVFFKLLEKMKSLTEPAKGHPRRLSDTDSGANSCGQIMLRWTGFWRGRTVGRSWRDEERAWSCIPGNRGLDKTYFKSYGGNSCTHVWPRRLHGSRVVVHAPAIHPAALLSFALTVCAAPTSILCPFLPPNRL